MNSNATNIQTQQYQQQQYQQQQYQQQYQLQCQQQEQEHRLIDHRTGAAINTYAEKRRIEFEFEKERQKLWEERKLKSALFHIEIAASDTDIFYGFRGCDQGEMKVAPVSPQGRLSLRGYETFYPNFKRVYVASFAEKTMVFPSDRECNARKIFQMLAAMGYRLACRKKIWGELVDAYWAYLLEMVTFREVPGVKGWNRMHSGDWFFATDGDLTMEDLK